MWETAFSGSVQPITQALLRRAVLPVWGKGFEKVSAAIAVRFALLAHAKPQTLFLLVPEASDTTARYIAAGLLVGDFAHKNGATHLIPREVGTLISGDLLLVTQSVSPSKTALEELKLGSQYPLGDLWDVAPLTRYLSRRYTKPRVYLANPGWAVDNLPKLPFGAVVIDATHPRTLAQLKTVLAGSVSKSPVRIVVLPPVDKAFLRACGYPTSVSAWLWDPQAKQDSDAIVGNDSQGAPEPTTRTMWVCGEDEEGAAALGAVHQRLTDMLHKAGDRPIPGLMHAWGIYHRLRQLTVPLVQLEQANSQAWGGNLKRRVAALAMVEGHGNPIWETTWPGLKSEIERAYEVFLQREEPAKFWVLASRVEEWLRNPVKNSYRIVVSSQQEAGLLWRMLEDAVDGAKDARAEGLIEITTASEEAKLIASGQYAHTLLSGARSTKTRYLDVFPHDNIEELAYPFEARMEQTVLEGLYEFAADLEDDAGRGAFLEPLGLKANASAPPCRKSPAPRLDCSVGEGRGVRLITEAAASGGIDIDRLADPGDTESDEQYRYGFDVGRAASNSDQIIEVDYVQGIRARYPDNHRVDVFFSATDQFQREQVNNLRPGWQVVSFVDDRYESLFNRVTEAVDHRLPQRDRMALALWREAKSAAVGRFNGDKGALFQELKSKGLLSDYAAALSWLREGDDDVLAPQQLEDFLVLANVSGCYPDESLMTRTFRCIQQHRVRHRQVGKALRALLRAILTGNGYEDALEGARKFDAAVGDVLSAVELLEVRSVRPIGNLLQELGVQP